MTEQCCGMNGYKLRIFYSICMMKQLGKNMEPTISMHFQFFLVIIANLALDLILLSINKQIKTHTQEFLTLSSFEKKKKKLLYLAMSITHYAKGYTWFENRMDWL